MAAGEYGIGWVSHLGIMLAMVMSAGLLALYEPMAAGGCALCCH